MQFVLSFWVGVCVFDMKLVNERQVSGNQGSDGWSDAQIPLPQFHKFHTCLLRQIYASQTFGHIFAIFMSKSHEILYMTYIMYIFNN